MYFALSKHLCFNLSSNKISREIKFQVPRFQATCIKEYGLSVHRLFIHPKHALDMVQAEVNIVVYWVQITKEAIWCFCAFDKAITYLLYTRATWRWQ
jgi:hypothetical protein